MSSKHGFVVQYFFQKRWVTSWDTSSKFKRDAILKWDFEVLPPTGLRRDSYKELEKKGLVRVMPVEVCDGE